MENLHHDDNCIFCKIIKGEIPSQKVLENEHIYAFKDITPAAPIHVLFVHRNHCKNINEMVEKNPQNIIDVFKAIKEFSEKEGIDQSGFRVISNIGVDGGQTVFHTHFHLLAGKKMRNL
ncbi:MAG: histidine triad nucleotide-binding protein [Oligoflexia bacterium]|nr:histidine triad nucleotide-binding protein [Oligoflexia bacterium]